jgi:hypothetical protein
MVRTGALELTRSRGHLILGETPRGRSPQWVVHRYIPRSSDAKAVELVRRGDRSMRQVAAGLGIPDQTLHNWIKAEDKAKARATDPMRSLSPNESELKTPAQGELRAETGPGDPPQGVGFFRQGDEPLNRFRFVSAHRDQYPVKALCRVAKVSRSDYYVWASRPPSERCIDDAYLTDTIRDIYQRSRSTYGAPRIHGQLCRIGTRVGRKRVAPHG